MTEPTDINEHRLTKGDLMFLHCAKCESHKYALVVTQGQDGQPVICNIICANCGDEHSVVHGVMRK